MTKVAKFNVGGKIYEVSRSLLERYPDTMLAKSSSKQWQEDSTSEIFIERDGELFRHVLSFLRDGHVALPVTETKKRLMLELQYYGVDSVNEESIDDNASQSLQCGNIYKKTIKGFNNDIRFLRFSVKCISEWSSDLLNPTLKGSESTKDVQFKTETGDSMSRGEFISGCNTHLNKVGLYLSSKKNLNLPIEILDFERFIIKTYSETESKD